MAQHTVTWQSGKPTFHCDGDKAAVCHQYPECDCETWATDGSHEHPLVGNEDCWMMPWLNQGCGDDYIGDEIHGSDEGTGTDVDAYSPWVPQYDGQIDGNWEGEWVSWNYQDLDQLRMDAVHASRAKRRG